MSRDAYEDELRKWQMFDALNQLTSFFHAVSREAGWWNDPETGEPYTPETQVPTKLLLIHSEVSEATEAFRKRANDDKLTDRDGCEVELADALIRIFDLAGAMGYDLAGAVREEGVVQRRARRSQDGQPHEGRRQEVLIMLDDLKAFVDSSVGRSVLWHSALGLNLIALLVNARDGEVGLRAGRCSGLRLADLSAVEVAGMSKQTPHNELDAMRKLHDVLANFPTEVRQRMVGWVLERLKESDRSSQSGANQ